MLFFVNAWFARNIPVGMDGSTVYASNETPLSIERSDLFASTGDDDGGSESHHSPCLGSGSWVHRVPSRAHNEKVNKTNMARV